MHPPHSLSKQANDERTQKSRSTLMSSSSRYTDSFATAANDDPSTTGGSLRLSFSQTSDYSHSRRHRYTPSTASSQPPRLHTSPESLQDVKQMFFQLSSKIDQVMVQVDRNNQSWADQFSHLLQQERGARMLLAKDLQSMTEQIQTIDTDVHRKCQTVANDFKSLQIEYHQRFQDWQQKYDHRLRQLSERLDRLDDKVEATSANELAIYRDPNNQGNRMPTTGWISQSPSYPQSIGRQPLAQVEMVSPSLLRRSTAVQLSPPLTPVTVPLPPSLFNSSPLSSSQVDPNIVLSPPSPPPPPPPRSRPNKRGNPAVVPVSTFESPLPSQHEQEFIHPIPSPRLPTTQRKVTQYSRTKKTKRVVPYKPIIQEGPTEETARPSTIESIQSYTLPSARRKSTTATPTQQAPIPDSPSKTKRTSKVLPPRRIQAPRRCKKPSTTVEILGRGNQLV